MTKVTVTTSKEKATGKKDAKLVCSFCGKSSNDVEKLMAGDKGNICNECILVASEAIRDTKSSSDSFKFAYQLLGWHFNSLRNEDIVTATRSFPGRVRVDLQIAMNALLDEWKPIRFVGVRSEYGHQELSVARLMENRQHAEFISPLQYEDIDIGETDPIKCLKNGLWLFENDGLRYAILMSNGRDIYHGNNYTNVELAVPMGERGNNLSQKFFRKLEEAVNQSQSYRGKVLSLEQTQRYTGSSQGITVHKLRPVDRDDIVLPDSALNLIDRNIISFARKRPELKKLGLSGKKGLLFYGPPGTGKTHTVHYLARHLPDHTTLLVTAEQVGLIKEYFMLARLLQPTILVIEDADLIARNRESMDSPCEEALLNTLLNEMDGLREDADIFFVLTTNRPEALELALSSRPGRIDQAIEFPLPDQEGREKLVKLYGANLKLTKELVTSIAKQTEGVSAAFIKELMRRTSQYLLDDEKSTSINAEHIDAALQEMLFSGGKLNVALLGGSQKKEE